MGLGCDALGQGQFYGRQHRLFIMVKDQRKDVDHLAVATRSSQHLTCPPERPLV